MDKTIKVVLEQTMSMIADKKKEYRDVEDMKPYIRYLNELTFRIWTRLQSNTLYEDWLGVLKGKIIRKEDAYLYEAERNKERLTENSNISKDIIIKNDHYSGDTFMNKKSGQKEMVQESTVKELGVIAEIIAGKSARSEERCKKGIHYLRAIDLKDGKISKTDVCINPKDAKKFARQLLQSGDILITKNYRQNKIAIVTEKDIPAIASDSLYVIRPVQVSEKYLHKYLTSQTGNEAFYAQISKIQRSTTVLTVTLADLNHVQIPVYDDETMQMIEGIDSVSQDEITETTEKILNILRSLSGPDIEIYVFQSLLSAGWNMDNLNRQVIISKDRKKKCIADIVYNLKDGRRVIVEVVSPTKKITVDDVAAIMNILQGDEEYFVVLTTGAYYEVHRTGIRGSLKTINPPSIDEILRWEQEVQ